MRNNKVHGVRSQDCLLLLKVTKLSKLVTGVSEKPIFVGHSAERSLPELVAEEKSVL